MAQLFEILSQYPTVEFVPPNRTRDVRRVVAEAKPSGVVFYFNVAGVGGGTSAVTPVAQHLATLMNTLFNRPGVVGVVNEEDVGTDGQLGVWTVVTVESTSGDSQGEVRMPFADALGDAGYKKVGALRTELNQVEAL